MNYLQKSPFRPVIFILIVIALLILTTWFSINNFFQKQKGKIQQQLSKYFNQKIFIGGLNYFPPSLIVLSDISILEEKNLPAQLSYSVGNIILIFSLKNLISERDFVIREIHLNKPRITFLIGLKKNFSEYVSGFQRLIETLSIFTKDNTLRFIIKDGLIIFPKENLLNYININILKIEQGGTTLSSGTISLNVDQNNKDYTTDYKLLAHLGQKDVAIDSLEFEKVKFYTRFWGILEKDTFRIRGVLSTGRFVDYANLFEEHRINIITKIKQLLLHRHRPTMRIIWPSLRDINIFDLDCTIKFTPSEVKIENLGFSFKNIPFSFKGNLSFLEQILLELKFSSYPNQPPFYRQENPKAFDMEIIGSLSKSIFNGKVYLSFIRKIENKISYEKIETNFKNLSFYLEKKRGFRMHFDEAEFLYPLGNNLYNLLFKNFNSKICIEDKKFRFVKFTSVIYDGLLEGDGIIDLAQIPFKNSFNLRLKRVKTDDLSAILIYFSNFCGRLDSQIYIQNLPHFNLYGNLVIQEGYLEDLKFFNWLADFFNIQAFKKLDFNKLSAEFLVNDDVASLNKIELESKEINLEGNFNLYRDELVSGKFSLALSKELLKTSDKFEPLLRLLDKNIAFVNFNFQLSGLFDSVNFKWLESDFKKKLQDLLPLSFERGIEESIDEAVKSISGR